MAAFLPVNPRASDAQPTVDELCAEAVPYGTHNHFARDAGLDRSDPIGALRALSGIERRVDIGRVDGRAFLNNVSLGAYAALVDEEERAGRFRAFLRIATRQRRTRLEIDGTQVSERIIVVGNKRLPPRPAGARNPRAPRRGSPSPRVARGWLPWTWIDRRDTRFRIESGASQLRAAVDGDVVRLEPPLDFAVAPGALRLLLPGP